MCKCIEKRPGDGYVLADPNTLSTFQLQSADWLSGETITLLVEVAEHMMQWRMADVPKKKEAATVLQTCSSRSSQVQPSAKTFRMAQQPREDRQSALFISQHHSSISAPGRATGDQVILPPQIQSDLPSIPPGELTQQSPLQYSHRGIHLNMSHPQPHLWTEPWKYGLRWVSTSGKLSS